MAKAQMPEEFYEELVPHLPPEQPVGPHGGRPRITHLVVMKVIWYVLVTGCRWEDVPLEITVRARSLQYVVGLGLVSCCRCWWLNAGGGGCV